MREEQSANRYLRTSMFDDSAIQGKDKQSVNCRTSISNSTFHDSIPPNRRVNPLTSI